MLFSLLFSERVSKALLSSLLEANDQWCHFSRHLQCVESAMAESIGRRRRKPPAFKGGRPCDACRRRKTRCIVETGQQKCNLCTYRQNPCTFDEEPPQRPTHAPPLNAHHESLAARASPSPQEVLNLVRFQDQNGSPAATLSSVNAQNDPDESSHPSASTLQRDQWTRSLGLNSTKFAELYGLGSDMEPILMVRFDMTTITGNCSY